MKSNIIQKSFIQNTDTEYKVNIIFKDSSEIFSTSLHYFIFNVDFNMDILGTYVQKFVCLIYSNNGSG